MPPDSSSLGHKKNTQYWDFKFTWVVKWIVRWIHGIVHGRHWHRDILQQHWYRLGHHRRHIAWRNIVVSSRVAVLGQIKCTHDILPSFLEGFFLIVWVWLKYRIKFYYLRTRKSYFPTDLLHVHDWILKLYVLHLFHSSYSSYVGQNGTRSSNSNGFGFRVYGV